MVHTMEEATKLARQRNHSIPRNITIYMDDCWCTILNPPRRTGHRSGDEQERNPIEDFNKCLNDVHSRVQFTREEEEDQSIAFLDVLVTRKDDGTLTTSVYRKPSNTNIGIKPQSCQAPNVAAASLKGELCRCHRLCTTTEQTEKEIEFTLNLYEDNGHNREKMKGIADNYAPPPQKPFNKRTTYTYKQKCTMAEAESHTKSLFDALPFRNTNIGDEEDKMFACIQYIPEIAQQMKKTLKKAGVATTFTSGTSLKDILCGKNTTHAPREKKKGIYRYTCSCSDKAIYIGQTHRSCETRWKDHERDVNKGHWQKSGITQHHQHCHKNFSLENFEVIHTMQDKKKGRLDYNLRMREAFEIRRHESGPGKGLNVDNGAYLKTDMWDPILKSLNT